VEHCEQPSGCPVDAAADTEVDCHWLLLNRFDYLTIVFWYLFCLSACGWDIGVVDRGMLRIS
jgi:hypothetical protein